MPDAARAGASNLVEAGGQRFLVDTGRGVLMRLAAAGAGMGQVTAVFLTHLHSDHVNDFNDVVTTSWIGQFTPGVLKVIGPTGTQRFVDATLAMLEDDICWRLDHHADLTWRPEVEVTEVTDGVAFEADGVRVVAAPTEHKPVHPTVGYRFEHEGAVVVCAGDTVPVRGPRPALCRRRRLRPDRVSPLGRRSHSVAPAPGHPRLPLRPGPGRARPRLGVGSAPSC